MHDRGARGRRCDLTRVRVGRRGLVCTIAVAIVRHVGVLLAIAVAIVAIAVATRLFNSLGPSGRAPVVSMLVVVYNSNGSAQSVCGQGKHAHSCLPPSCALLEAAL